jgi:hypothetical protein
VPTVPVVPPVLAQPPVAVEPPIAVEVPIAVQARAALVDSSTVLPTSVSLPSAPARSAGPLAQLAALQARLVEAVPPHWIELARKHPVSWMAAAPVALATLLILVLLAFEPPRAAEQPSPVAGSAATRSHDQAAPAAAPAAEAEKPSRPSLAELEAKPADTLSVEDLLLLNESRAEQKRTEARALSRRLRDQAELAKDPAVQGQLLRLAADPDTTEAALAAMAQTRSPVGPDLLFEVWTNRSTTASTAELARSLLYSREVRPNASPALAAALQLRAADSCDATRAALPQALNDGDRRALPSLAKINLRRGCGAKKDQDCYACLRAEMKGVVAAIGATKRRPAPSYPAR